MLKCSLPEAFLLASGACLGGKCSLYEAFLLAFGACLRGKCSLYEAFYWHLGHVLESLTTLLVFGSQFLMLAMIIYHMNIL